MNRTTACWRRSLNWNLSSMVARMKFRSLLIAMTALPLLAGAAPPTGEAASGKQHSLLSSEYGHDDRAPNAVKVGEVGPDFTLPTADGGTFSLAAQAAKGEVVLVFYRGSW
jgi:hypothetical protein